MAWNGADEVELTRAHRHQPEFDLLLGPDQQPFEVVGVDLHATVAHLLDHERREEQLTDDVVRLEADVDQRDAVGAVPLEIDVLGLEQVVVELDPQPVDGGPLDALEQRVGIGVR